jgi:hypothetical protein
LHDVKRALCPLPRRRDCSLASTGSRSGLDNVAIRR